MDMLANRVRKNARHLGKWAKREHVTCWRIYDRDIPEIPLTIDTYEGVLVISDYRAFDRDDRDGWLDAAVDAVRGVLAPSDVFVKHRERFAHRAAGQQYEREAERGAWRTVHEAGHKFRVNLSDYIDTGLFLDHRITRAKAAAEPARTMLNLFGYTGAFSVYAAAAGMQTTTVDLSNTYLAWAAENLALNRLDGEIVHADAREFLVDARRAGRRWELVVVDPPTFSNSKRMDGTWDVQRDHVALLEDVLAVCSGVVWFSTNRRRFKLELSDPSLAITDMTHATIPPDFRDQKIHHAYRIARGR
ncbi:MAG TPA: class I SAM-dependent methyltransferase [Kofleriaceae bacterium]|jgi:23S rRNA (cytosine1962-C5)-methyltransferase|nr:class I SAM-dependent methyltransferase [Kofleriaceae bacterium]